MRRICLQSAPVPATAKVSKDSTKPPNIEFDVCLVVGRWPSDQFVAELLSTGKKEPFIDYLAHV